MLTSFSCRLGRVARYESVLASSRAEMMSMILTVPVSRARALNSSSSPLRTARSWSCRSTISSPS
jgi:hypothetical protein